MLGKLGVLVFRHDKCWCKTPGRFVLTQEVQTGVGEEGSTEVQEEALSETERIPNAEEGDSTVVEEGTASGKFIWHVGKCKLDSRITPDTLVLRFRFEPRLQYI